MDDHLITIDLSSGAATIIGPLGSGGRDTSGLAFRGDGTLFGVALGRGTGDEVIKIDPATGATTDVGPTGTDVSTPSVAGLAFNPDSGALYYSATGNLYQVNTNTGAVSLVGFSGVETISGLPSSPSPR